MVTDEQRANLLKLAEYLERPDLQAMFDMSFFCDDEQNDNENRGRPVHDCGSVGCAIGHGPFAGIEKMPHERWSQYGNRAFARGDGSWSWCFSPSWSRTDNTPMGAAARIRWMLDRGVPHDAEEQARGRAPLCYRP